MKKMNPVVHFEMPGADMDRMKKFYEETFGWQMVSHPIRNMALLNVPASGVDTVYQFAFNTVTGAWGRFKNMEASCWNTFDNEIYFGSMEGIVYKADSGGADNGEA